MAEVQFGSLANDRAASPAVRDFGARMVTEHHQANEQLKALAAVKNISFPTEISDEARTASARLARLSGNEFDAVFMNRMVQDHQAAVVLFQQEAADGNDADIKNWAARMLPILEKHLRSAQDILANLGR
jgi:putative membrane protein